MNQDPTRGASKIHASKSHGDGGGAGKWLLGALAAVVLLGGGYYAWKTMAPQQSTSELAYNDDSYADESLRAGALPSDDLSADSAMSDDAPGVEPASAPSETRRTATQRTTTTASAEAVPEATIGVTPVSLTTTSEEDEIIVNAPRRPIWVDTPSERRMASLYPARALQQGLEGEASLSCTVMDGGALDCDRVSETNDGFGTAALRVSRQLRHASYTASGAEAVGTPVNLHVVFRMEDGARRG